MGLTELRDRVRAALEAGRSITLSPRKLLPYLDQAAIVDKLPKTTDGVPMVPGMRLWFKYGGHVVSEVVESLGGYFHNSPVEESRWVNGEFDADECYSTQEAARAAGGNP